MQRDFLFEIGAEEMPPKALQALADALQQSIVSALDAAGIAHARVRRFATPRRLAVLIEALHERAPDRQIERRGPPLRAAFDAAGEPTQAATAFARSCGVGIEALTKIETDKGSWLAYRGTEAGAPTRDMLPGIVTAALAALPIPKRMRWGASDVEFVRPVHWLALLYGADVIDAEILGLRSGRTTHGHRFHHPRPIELRTPADYERSLLRAKVVAAFERRRELIRAAVERLAAGIDGGDAAPLRAVIDAELLDEVTALVEWPVPIAAQFEARYLELPREVVISTVQHHQRYFPVETRDGKLTQHFITVSNIESRHPELVRQGNERVVRPRLSDAAFFWQQDRRSSLAEHARALSRVTFQAKLGSYADKTARIEALATALAPKLGAGPDVALAANLAKADLMTAMVNEFPDLQGTMGRHYALAEGLPAAVATALEEQYQPRFAADRLPASPLGRALALADRLDTLTGIFAIDQKPTGTKDPFGLRRAALGVLRILLDADLDVDLAELVAAATARQPVRRDAAAAECHEFIIERMRGLEAELGPGATGEILDAVLAAGCRSPVDIARRIDSMRDFLALPDATSLAAANKRIGNILRKTTVDSTLAVEPSLLTEPAERALHDDLLRVRPVVAELVAGGRYTEALRELTTLRRSVDAFFDHVMVMDENAAYRNNRLALLRDLRTLLGAVADLAKLPG